ncbi:MAG: hypothetical protein IJ783_08025, partial [Kiritimatiellae bacterium]|nr:hypothetical protein [Kiritimatiellia bacterium]
MAIPAAPRDLSAAPRLAMRLAAHEDDNFPDDRPLVILSSGVPDTFPTNSFARLPEWIDVFVEDAKIPFDPVIVSGSRDAALGIMPQTNAFAAQVRVKVSKNLPAPAGALPLEDDFDDAVLFSRRPVAPSAARAYFRHFEPAACADIAFSRFRASPDSVLSNLVFDPAVPDVRYDGGPYVDCSYRDSSGNLQYESGQGVRLRGSFKPGVRYRAFLRPGADLVTDAGAALRAGTNAVSFVVPNPDVAVRFAQDERNLPPTALSAVDVVTHATDSVQARLLRVLPQNLVHALAARGGLRRLGAEFCEKTGPVLEAKIGESGVATNALALADFAPDAAGAALPEGLYCVSVTARAIAKGKDRFAPDEDSDWKLVNLSDVGIAARRVGADIQAWVVRLSTAEPVPGARVTLYSSNNTVASEAEADADGVALLSVGEGVAPAVLVADLPGGGYGFLQLDEYENGVEEFADRPGERFPENPSQLDGFLFSDRGLYRHGDSVFLQGLVRTAAGPAPEPLPLSLEIRRPDGALVETLAVRTDARGFFAVKDGWTAPASQPSGRWTASLCIPGKDGPVIARREFSVESFAPPKIVVEAPDSPESVPFGTTELPVKIAARWQFGTPASGLPAKASLVPVPVPFEPEPWCGQGWSAGDDGAWKEVPSIPEKDATLADDGAATAVFDLSAFVRRGGSPLVLVR